MPMQDLKKFNTCISDSCKAEVAHAVTPFWLVQNGENHSPNANLMWLQPYFSPSFIQLLHSSVFLMFFSGDVWDSCGLVITFHLFFLSTGFSFSPEFTFLTYAFPISHPFFSLALLCLCSSLPFPCRASLLMDGRDGPFPAAGCSRCSILILLSAEKEGLKERELLDAAQLCWSSCPGCWCELALVGHSWDFSGFLQDLC